MHHLNCNATTVILNTGFAPNVKLTISRQSIIPVISQVFGQFPYISHRDVKFPDISRFSGQVVTVSVLDIFKLQLNGTLMPKPAAITQILYLQL